MFIKIRGRHSGFVLYESIVALMITIMTLGILQQSLQILHSVQKTTFREQLRWHITQEKLQNKLGKAKIVSLDDFKIVYKNKSERKWVIEKYQMRMLRITTADKGGHEPIMVNLRKINIEKKDKLVNII